MKKTSWNSDGQNSCYCTKCIFRWKAVGIIATWFWRSCRWDTTCFKSYHWYLDCDVWCTSMEYLITFVNCQLCIMLLIIYVYIYVYLIKCMFFSFPFLDLFATFHGWPAKMGLVPFRQPSTLFCCCHLVLHVFCCIVENKPSLPLHAEIKISDNLICRCHSSIVIACLGGWMHAAIATCNWILYPALCYV